MQLWLLRQRFRTYCEAVCYVNKSGEGVILDRSVYSDWVFAENSRRDGTISPEGFDYYSKLRTHMLKSLPDPTLVLYLDVRAEECFRRIREVRKRDCEMGIPLEVGMYAEE